ncbi:MAG: hypothetical protein A3I88_02695 [Candidatus Portnoybacteria bacterium RIFCSPLOWO2_12_FULL_39_9]|uniref:Uncharacterized protein n=1 Tax=Candidatus Portnoybacteria bacterium RIFCSPHIGHO2_12_FULL_38_9 TaxID=1801997 RepID=A0A1G2FGC8_9BACT|nr:MAG: hypothetical protein A3H00_01995 [Candidatus Portnoybacteria bacterium RBG_13_40_8]OGZ36106.1 MAG: hypothetical protein A2646_02625 [Candidatus Portnoybacteria bacterium RIFCSPHIGHO2_02_FULL_39_12]OGZ36700.1 MAG: hypothetical protein A3J64_00280 [Candidatus Portnoybacteria bacterium RIFCSPHIGHO2_12_FULL_38_9]OGZ38459.1 MAG: hypothetical protein A3F21_02565 [Candidatus Portnoybacteria bacterium RIFCSPLOWO2_01_FULL_38_39]OGZ40358.1 MAG: hypothetical protein A3I88_02695 [Candidatus Portnoy
MKKGRIRQTELHRRQKRREKLKKLRAKFALAKNNEEKERILEKVRRMAPWLLSTEFLKPLEKEK